MKTAAKNKELQGEDFYKRIGAIGGTRTFPGKGFAGNRERARLAGKKGGKVSNRTGVKNRPKADDGAA